MAAESLHVNVFVVLFMSLICLRWIANCVSRQVMVCAWETAELCWRYAALLGLAGLHGCLDASHSPGLHNAEASGSHTDVHSLCNTTRSLRIYLGLNLKAAPVRWGSPEPCFRRIPVSTNNGAIQFQKHTGGLNAHAKVTDEKRTCVLGVVIFYYFVRSGIQRKHFSTVKAETKSQPQ